MNLNWKYNQWMKKQNCEFNDIGIYISQNIEAEDIEIFSNILMPTVMEYKGGILFCGLDLTDEDFNSTKKLFDFCLLNHKSIPDAERSANELRIYDIFLIQRELVVKKHIKILLFLLSKIGSLF